MADDVKVLVGAELNLDDAIRQLAELQKQVDANTKAQKELDRTTEEGQLEYQRLRIESAQLRAELAKQTKAVLQQSDAQARAAQEAREKAKADKAAEQAARAQAKAVQEGIAQYKAEVEAERQAAEAARALAEAQKEVPPVLQTTFQGLGQLRSELRQLQKQDLTILPEEEARAVVQRISRITQEIDRTRATINAFDTSKTFANIAQGLSVVTASVGILGNTLSALGVQAGVLDKIRNSTNQLIQTVQGLNTLVQFVRANRLLQLQLGLQVTLQTIAETVARKALTAQMVLQNAAETGNIAVRTRAIVVTKLWTAAQWLLNAALNAGLGAIGLIVAAVAGLVIGVKALVGWLSKESEELQAVNAAQEEYNRLKQNTAWLLEDLTVLEEAEIGRINKFYDDLILKLKEANATQEEIAKATLDRENDVRSAQIAFSRQREEELTRELESVENLLAAQNLALESVEKGTAKYGELVTAINEAEGARVNLIRSINAEYFARERLINQTSTAIVEYKKGGAARVASSKSSTDSVIKDMERELNAKKAFDLARLRAEAAYQSTDLKTKQEYARRVQQIEFTTQAAVLEAQRKNRKITEEEYQQSLEILNLAQTEFANGQIKELNDYWEEQRKQLLGLVTQTAEEQIQAIEKRYRQAIDDLEKIQPPQRLIGQSDEEYQKALRDYEAFQLQQTQLAVRFEQERENEIREVRAQALREREALITANLTKEYAQQLAEADRNEERRLSIIEEGLKREIAARRAAGLTVFEQEAQLRDIELQQQRIQYNKALLLAGENAEERYRVRREYLQAELLMYEEGSLERLQIEQDLLDAEKELWDERYNLFTTWASQISDLLTAITSLASNNVDKQVAKYKEGQEDQRKELQRRLNSGLISQEKYNEKVAELDAALDAEQRRLQLAAAKREKALKIFQAVTDTAAGIIKAVAQAPLRFGLPYSAFVAATGAAQVAAIAAEPLNIAARGMYISGNTHAQGGELIEAEDGEVVINRRSTAMFGPLLSAINQAGGGVPFRGLENDGGYALRTLQGESGLSADELAAVLQDNLHIYLDYEDFKEGEKKYVESQEKGSIFSTAR